MLLLLQEAEPTDDQATTASEETASATPADESAQESPAETTATTEVVATDPVDYSLNGTGMALMGISITTVICLLGFCLFRVLMAPASETD